VKQSGMTQSQMNQNRSPNGLSCMGRFLRYRRVAVTSNVVKHSPTSRKTDGPQTSTLILLRPAAHTQTSPQTRHLQHKRSTCVNIIRSKTDVNTFLGICNWTFRNNDPGLRYNLRSSHQLSLMMSTFQCLTHA
jgi:hypothetical protein